MAINLSLNKLPWYGQVLFFVALSVVGGVVFWTYYAKPVQASIAERQQQLATLRAEIDRGRATARRLPEFRRQVVDLEAQLDMLRAVLPSDQDVADLLRRVQAMATESNLTIRGFTPQAVARKQLHAEWPFGLKLEGTYHNFGAFLERVSKFPRIINVSQIKLEAREAQTAAATVAIDATAMTFVLLENPPAAPAEGKGKAKGKGKEAKGE
jgi:type IV pilus assembly protein PilO